MPSKISKLILSNNFKRAFSLVEVSVVLVIISVLVGLILGITNLRAVGQIKSFVTDIKQIQSSFLSFKTQYQQIPGDISNASDYFGSDITNGDGNSEIDFLTSDEPYLAWQHLSLAGFTEKGYIGDSGGGTIAIAGINIMESERSGVGYNFFHSNSLGRDLNTIILGKNSSSILSLNSAVTSSEAFAIDKKLDDGDPEAGDVQAEEGVEHVGQPGDFCVVSNAYNIASDDYECGMIFNAEP